MRHGLPKGSRVTGGIKGFFKARAAEKKMLAVKIDTEEYIEEAIGPEVVIVADEVGFIPAENPESGMRINEDGNKEWFLEVGTLIIPDDEADIKDEHLDILLGLEDPIEESCTAGYCQIIEEEKEAFDAVTPDDIITDKELEEEIVAVKPKKKKKRSRKKKATVASSQE